MNKKMLAMVLAGTTTLVGCGGAAATGEPDPMQFRIAWDVESGRGQAIQTIVDEYNEQTDGRKVEVVSGNYETEDIITSQAEIVQLEYFLATSLGEQGYFYDLSEDFAYANEFFSPAVMDMVSVGDATYGMPWLGHSMSIIYNKELLDQAGVNPDEITTWDAFEEALIQVEANTDAKGIGMVGRQSSDLSWMVAMFVHSFGGELVTEDGTVGIASPESKEGLDFYFNTLGQYGQPGWQEHTGQEVMEAFRVQNVAFQIQGPWAVTDIWKLDEENQFEIGVMSMSQIMHGEYMGAAETSVHTLTISTLAEGEVLEDAKDFVDFMITKEAQEMLMLGEYSEETGEYYPFRVPLRNDLQDSEYFVEHPEFIGFIEGFDNPSVEVPVPAWTEIRDRYLVAGYNAIANGTRTIDEVTQEVEERGNDILGN